MHAQSLQSCPTLWVPMDYIPPDSSAHGILQARILEWVDMQPKDWTWVSWTSALQENSLPAKPPGKSYRQCTYQKSNLSEIHTPRVSYNPDTVPDITTLLLGFYSKVKISQSMFVYFVCCHLNGTLKWVIVVCTQFVIFWRGDQLAFPKLI